ncbi:MAG: VWA domain-containing protein [bacterium]
MKKCKRNGFGGLLMAGLLMAGSAMAARVEKVTCRVDLDRAVLPAGDVRRAVIKVSLDAPALHEKADRQAVNLTVVLDRSGSMSNSGKLEKAKEAAITALRRLGARDLFSLVVYDHEVETVVPPQSAANTEWIESRINAITTRGNTALFAGVSQAAAEIRKHIEDKYVHRILLLSDGQANSGPSQPEDLGRLGAALMKERIAVTTIGVGTDYNEDLMTKLAQNSDGNTYFVESSLDLPRIFAAELGDVLSVFARDVVLEIEFLGGVRPIRIIGRDGRMAGRCVEIRLNNLYGGQEKYVLVEVEVPAQTENDTLKLASARCTYRNLISSREEQVEAAATVRFSKRESDVSASANLAVQKDLMLNEMAEAKDAAIRQADKGNRVEAAVTLRAASGSVLERAKAYNITDARVLKEAELTLKYGEAVEEKGLGNVDRKAMRTDSYQMRNQQLAH